MFKINSSDIKLLLQQHFEDNWHPCGASLTPESQLLAHHRKRLLNNPP